MVSPPFRILVVDDNEALRENLVETLELEGYTAIAAADGPGALARLAEDPPPALVLLDLVMPGMSGQELLGRIRDDPRLAHVRVIVTSGLSGARARAARADAVLMKPFGVKELLAAIRKVGAPAPASS